MSFEAPHKKVSPAPLHRALDAGVAPRKLSPLQRFAIPAGIALGLGLTGAGMALELKRASDEGSSAADAVVRTLTPLKWLAPEPRPQLGGAPPGPSPDSIEPAASESVQSTPTAAPLQPEPVSPRTAGATAPVKPAATVLRPILPTKHTPQVRGGMMKVDPAITGAP